MTFGRLFVLSLAALVLARLLLVADLTTLIVFSPHDDSLYVARAMHLLSEGTFGPYDSRVLAKVPGMSYLLAGLRTLGLPYMTALNLLHIAAGLYAVAAMRRCGAGTIPLLLAFALYLFSPITMAVEWIRVLREPPSIVMLTATFGAMLHVFACVREGRAAWRHLVLLGALLSFSMLLREEDVLLWALLGFYAIAVWAQGKGGASRWRQVVLVLAVPAAMIVAVNQAARHESARWYGLPILHDYGEGEFPRLYAAIRGIASAKDNRLVGVTQEALAKLRVEVPEFAPVIDRIPPPGPTSLSCRLQGVCSEWSNGWMPFWIKDAAYQAGKTPDLVSGQAYFRQVREAIEAACKAGRLECRDAGRGFLPVFELRWTRAYVQAFGQVALLGLLPVVSTFIDLPSRFDVPPEFGRMFQAVTMAAYYDSQIETMHSEDPGRMYRNPRSHYRPALALPYQAFAALLLVLALVALAWRWSRAGTHPPGALLVVGTVIYAFILLRMAALAYVAVYLGPFESRVMYANHIVAVLLAPLLIADAWRARGANR